ncbi:unnamed protein product [Euphydryas editha]|uniref:Cuticle protein n=1 Tax=Euphydryas editha TaxID=104508 RepID=A0AAU9TRK9_EUPED|nr:unnamed protein product [Euphydryas editha]
MNSYLVVSCFFALSAVAVANPPALLSYAEVGSIPNSNYEFNYAVNDPSTGDNKAQWESRNGDVVRGAYSLVEPDGNVRIVEYTADAVRGFNAIVKRTGPNVHSVGVVAEPVAIVKQPIIESAPIIPIAKQIIEPVAPIAPVAKPIYEHFDDIGQNGAPLYGSYDSHGYDDYGFVQPASLEGIDHGPMFAPIKEYYSAPAPWVSLSGTSYGSKGKIVRRWVAGPISLDGKTLTIKTKN